MAIGPIRAVEGEESDEFLTGPRSYRATATAMKEI
jgi:hypothetical protein